MDKSEIEKLAELSKINLTEEEKESFAGEMNDILSYVSEIEKIEGADSESTLPEHRNMLRNDEDAHKPCEYTEALLGEAPVSEDGYVKVKKVL